MACEIYSKYIKQLEGLTEDSDELRTLLEHIHSCPDCMKKHAKRKEISEIIREFVNTNRLKGSDRQEMEEKVMRSVAESANGLLKEAAARPRVCLLDDSREVEIKLFKDVFNEDLHIVAGTTFAECKLGMKEKEWELPDLYIIDFYSPTTNVTRKKRRASKRAERRPKDNGTPLGTVRFRAWLDRMRGWAEEELKARIQASGESSRHHRQLIKELHAQSPKVPIVVYSRKATQEDLQKARKLPGVYDAILKPTGEKWDQINWGQVVEFTKENKGPVLDCFKNAIDRAREINNRV